MNQDGSKLSAAAGVLLDSEPARTVVGSNSTRFEINPRLIAAELTLGLKLTGFLTGEIFPSMIYRLPAGLRDPDVLGLPAFRPLDHVKLNRLTFLEGTIPLTLDG